MMLLLVGVVAGRRESTYPLVVVRYFVAMLCVIHGWPVCVIGDVCDDSLVENGQQTSYGPCGLGAVGCFGAEEVCDAACRCVEDGGCSRVSAHDALASLYAAKCACAGAGDGAPYGLSSLL